MLCRSSTPALDLDCPVPNEVAITEPMRNLPIVLLSQFDSDKPILGQLFFRADGIEDIHHRRCLWSERDGSLGANSEVQIAFEKDCDMPK